MKTLKIAAVAIACIMAISCQSKSPKVDKEKVETVMAFLNNTRFNCGPYNNPTPDQSSLVNVYTDFKYDNKTYTLKWKERGGPLGPTIPEYEHVIELKTAKPIVRMEPKMFAANVLNVSLLGNCQLRDLGPDSSYAANDIKVATKDETTFVVDGEVGPRLKAALEDLLRAHGVKVPTY